MAPRRPLLPEYAPPGESAADLWLERSNLVGIIIAGVAYGVLFTIFVQCMLLLPKSGTRGMQARWLMTYSSVVFLLASCGFGGNTKFIQMSYIDYRNYPGGPNAFTFDFYTEPANIFSIVSYVLMNWMVDGLLIYRFMVIYNNRYVLLIAPMLVYLGMISCSISMLKFTLSDGFFVQPTVAIGTAYWSLSIALNIGITLCIGIRLLRMRQNLREALGPHHSSPYTSVLSMIVESAVLYTVWAFVFMVTYAKSDTFQNIVLPSLGQVQAIAPLLIIFRVAQGKAWTSSTGTTTGDLTTFNASRRNTSGTDSSRGTKQSYPLTTVTDSGVHFDIDGDKLSKIPSL